MILEQRRVRREIVGAPQPRSIGRGQTQRRDPKRAGERGHQRRAIRRKPRQAAGVKRLLRARFKPALLTLFGLENAGV
jgi:hypothetical protein